MNQDNTFIQGEPSPHHGSKVFRIIGMAFIGVIFAAGFALVFGLLVMLLWNWVMPALFGLGKITYWQAFGVLLLAKLFFGGFGSYHRDHSDHFYNRFFPGWDHLKDRKKVDSWKHFRKFWKDEGRDKYKEYVHRKKPEKGEIIEEQ